MVIDKHDITKQHIGIITNSIIVAMASIILAVLSVTNENGVWEHVSIILYRNGSDA